jgi:hypothetical protein
MGKKVFNLLLSLIVLLSLFIVIVPAAEAAMVCVN